MNGNDLEIYWPYKPYLITQRWGNPNSAYEQFGFSLHNGVDANIGGDKTNYLVYCPVSGFTVQHIDYRAGGGGNEIWMVSDEPLQMFERKCRAYLVLCHAANILVKVGDKPALGELIMIADNTGFSTGPHTHMGLYRVDYNDIHFTYLDQNDANGSFSPELFFMKQYAVDVATYGTLVTNGLRYFKYLLGGGRVPTSDPTHYAIDTVDL